MSEISSGLVAVAWSYVSPLGTVRKLQDRSPCLDKPEEHHWTPLVRLSDAEAIIAKQSAALKLAREALVLASGTYNDYWDRGMPIIEPDMDKALAAINEVLKGE